MSDLEKGQACGDGIVARSETCDDGNTVGEDGCSAECQVESGWECESFRSPVCDTICADGLKRGSEECDDGNTTAGDGCSVSCTIEKYGDCTGDGPGSCECKPPYGGENCDECASDKLTGELCDTCVSSIFTGPTCEECSNSNFAAPECTNCLPQFAGATCEECSNPNTLAPECTMCKPEFAGARCDECSNPRFEAPSCDSCLPAFTGPNCEQCIEGLTGENCELCIDPRFSGALCDQCADPRFSGPKCDRSSCTSPEKFGKDCWPIVPTRMPDCYNEALAFDPVTNRPVTIMCPGTPGDAMCPMTPYCGQDGQYEDANVRTYRCVDANGQALASCPPRITGEVVEDMLTGLSWQRDSYLASSRQNALDYCRDLEYGGHGDWRLPESFELLSLVEYGDGASWPGGSAIDAMAFPNTRRAYLSATNTCFGPMLMDFSSDTRISFMSFSSVLVRCVRGGSRRVSDLGRYQTVSIPRQELAQDVVLDSLTGLMWQPDAVGGKNWSEALSHCEASTHAGFTDWRLPNINAAASLLSNTSSVVATGFPNMLNELYWTSTTCLPDDPHQAYMTHFFLVPPGVGACQIGTTWREDKAQPHFVRCVR